jgi:hypothetical protein
MLESLIAGNRDPAALADLAKRRLRAKIPALTEALTGRFTEHHAFLARVHLDLIDQHTAAIDEITSRIEETMAPFHGFHTLICTIPGISPLTAGVIIAETGADMTRFPTAARLASWAGTTPGNNESAGKVKSSRTRPGNPYLQGALGAAAMACAAQSTHLSWRPLPPHRRAPRTPERQRRDPAFNPDRHLAHGNQRLPLQRRWRRPLQPTPPRTSQKAGHQPTRSHGLPSHPYPRQLITDAHEIFASGGLR